MADDDKEDAEVFSMKELTFVDAVRYVFSGVIAFCFYAIADEGPAKVLATTLGPIGLPLVLAVLGTLIYFVYRPLAYDLIIHPIHGMVRGTQSNYCKLLKARYKITSNTARSLFRQIVAVHLAPEHLRLAAVAAGTHMTYMASLLSFGFACRAWFQKDSEEQSGFLIASGVLLICGWLLDWRLERQETDMIKRIGVEKWDQIATSLGIELHGRAGNVVDQPPHVQVKEKKS